MSTKTIIMRNNVNYRDGKAICDSKLVIGGLVFVAVFVLLAYILGNAEIATSPFVPSRIL